VSYATGGPSCIVFQYEGIPGLVELKIPKYLIEEFPVITEVLSVDLPFNKKQIPFQIISDDASFMTVRIELPANYDVIEIQGTQEGSMYSHSPFLNKVFGLGFILSFTLWIVCFIGYTTVKKTIVWR
jgi:hypothetical protein